MAPNSIGPTGLILATQAELLANYTAQFQAIYQDDTIDLSSDTPDGQMINLFIQSVLDLQDLLAQIYNTFDPDNAIGVILDQRAAINGVQRQAGTFTVTPITVINNQSVNLYGLDQSIQPIYTVSDNAGNLWELQTSQIGVTSGTHVFSFQAANQGAVLTTPNTITVPVTIVLGVLSVNNPSTYSVLGTNEESDANFKVRRLQSVSLASQGYLKGLLAALENINGVTSAFVYENLTGATNVDGVPGHSIWVIVAGSGAASDIANAIYEKRNAGCGMFGQTSFVITQVDGTLFTVFWDDVSPQNLFISFTATSIDGVNQPNLAAIRSGLVTSFVPGVFQEVNINQLATLVQQIDPNCLVTQAGFSLGQTQILTLSGVAASGAFVLNYNGNTSSSINWNDSISTIQTKLQSITGLTSATVSGSIASQTLTFDLSLITDVQGLLFVSANTLHTSGAVLIQFSYNEGYSNTLFPSKKSNQFLISSPNIIIILMILSPPTASVETTNTQTFTGLGGYGDYTYSFVTNNSGGTIDFSTGVYTAGSTPLVMDTVSVTDSMGNMAISTVSVT